MASDFHTIRYRRDGDIGTLILARPAKRNAQNPQMWRELAALGRELLADDGLRCLVVAGEGQDFSAGIDLVEGIGGMLGEFTAGPESKLAGGLAGPESKLAGGLAGPESKLAEGLAAAGTFNWIPELGCASVAAVQGHAYGAGLQLALACDFRVFADDAKVGLLETRYGLLPDMGATVRLPRLIGEGRAREMILLGEVVDAAEALRMGLANRVVPAAELAEAAAAFAARVAAQPPIAVRGARRALEAAWHSTASEAFQVAVAEQIQCLKSEDFAEARHALAESRRPVWRGR